MLFILILTNIVIAENCQYKETEIQQKEVLRLINSETDEEWGFPLEFSDFISGSKGSDSSNCIASFKITNPNNQIVNTTLSFRYTWKKLMGSASKVIETRKIIKPNGVEKVEYRVSRCFDNPSIDPNSITYTIYDNNFIEPIIRTEKVEVEVCKKCKAEICLDDGAKCNLNEECGSGFCIEGYCSNNNLCFENDCRCASDEIQCNDNQRCVKKGAIPLDVTPKCGLSEECIYGYIAADTGKCAKSPSLLKEEQNERSKFYTYSVIALIIIFIIGIAVYFILKNKAEKETQRTLQKRIEYEAKKIEAKEHELNELKNQINEIKRQKNLEKREIDELNSLKEERKKLEINIQEQYKKITKPFFDHQVLRKVIIVPEVKGNHITWEGYKCFYKKDKNLDQYTYKDLVHIWIWRKNNGRYPRPRHHIHHIDGDKLNNDPRNLEEIEGHEHYEKHRNNLR